MLRSLSGRTLALLLTLLMLAAACSSRDDESTTSGGGDGGKAAEDLGINTDDCKVDPTQELEGDTINLVSSYPQSGLTAAFSKIALGYKAYFDYINQQGGVDIGGKKVKIEVSAKDDTYNAAKTAQNIRADVGTGDDLEKAFAVFSVVGTANNIAIRETLGSACVPNVFAATGSPAWGNPDFPWMIGSSLSPYTLEGEVFANYLKEEKPDAKVAMLVQDDDFGRAYEEGFSKAIEGTEIKVVKVEKYATGANEVGAQITALAGTDADAFFNGATLLACPDALTKAKAQNWEPLTWVSSTCTSKVLMGLADANQANNDVVSMINLKDPLNPKWDDDEAMKLFRAEIVKAEDKAEGDEDSGVVAYGWTQGALLVEAMKNMEKVTRLDLMNAVRNMDGIEAGLLLPGIGVTTGEDDNFLGETTQLVQYDSAKGYFEIVGEPIDFEGKTGELSPKDLIESK